VRFRPGSALRISVNGEAREVKDAITVLELLQELSVVQARVAVEVNAVVVRKARHAEHHLREGDRIEVVTFVGGG
jgi:sulfur carrier protein